MSKSQPAPFRFLSRLFLIFSCIIANSSFVKAEDIYVAPNGVDDWGNP